MSGEHTSAKTAFMIISDDPTRAVPGIVMTTRMKMNRGVDIRVLFFGPSIKLAASDQIDSQLADSRDAGIGATACRTNVEQYEVTEEIGVRRLKLLPTSAEVESFAREGCTVVTFWLIAKPIAST